MPTTSFLNLVFKTNFSPTFILIGNVMFVKSKEKPFSVKSFTTSIFVIVIPAGFLALIIRSLFSSSPVSPNPNL